MGISKVEAAVSAKMTYPWYIIFILGNEFCERFTYYGMKTVLTLYFRKVLFWSEDTTTFFYHFFTMLCYFFPIMGACLADGLIGKFRTIFYLSIVYILGLVILTLSAVPPVHFHAIAGTLSGLLLIAIGTGGIKPCVSAYGADQFKAGQEAQRERFFAYFYFCINAGSLISTFVTPLLRSDVHCFEAKTCYSLAFGVPAALMAVALVLFLIGKPFYTDTPVAGSLISRVFLCICHAIANNFRGRKNRKLPRASITSESPIIEQHLSGNPLKRMQTVWRRKGTVSTTHWLDSAADKYDTAFIADVKQLLHVLLMFVPIPMFWALFDQQGSRWTLQANKMDGRMTDSYSFQPDQVQIFNPVLILIFIPIFEWVVYPVIHKLKIPFRLLARMVVGMLLAGVAFVIAGFVQIALDKTMPMLPSAGNVELRIFNANPCNLSLSGPLFSADRNIAPYEMVHIPNFPLQQNTSVLLVTKRANCPRLPNTQSNVIIYAEDQSVYSVVLLNENGQLIDQQWKVQKDKPEEGDARVQFVVPFQLNTSSGDGIITLINPDLKEEAAGHRYDFFINGSLELRKNSTQADNVQHVAPGKYVVYLSDETSEFGKSVMGTRQLNLPNGGVYTVLLKDSGSSEEPWTRYDIVEPNSLNIFWQFPQYFVITLAEVFLSVSGLSFAYSEAPESMKSVMQAAWLLTSAFGSIIVMVFSGAHLVPNQAAEFFVFAGLIVIFAIIFAFMSKFYDYLEPGGKDEVEQDGTIEMDRRAAKKNDDYVTQTSRQDLMEARS